MTIDKVKEIISAQINKPVDEIKDDSKIVEDLGADSLDLFQVVMDLEDAFNVKVENDEEWTKIKDVMRTVIKENKE